ncbi:DUF4369 domain-containing protein [Marixanthomonas sp. SCSIO 43207]|uniref:DUF4369 domain-containing protein n=1 Tax=Marixanthomonas sp. SCSIO 43207 TaxID=2779360 RepID=UPI001CA7DB52|nr:DUF4369 domain-containing protein [Marixanthomonas sp. SCSIO 43207]UAB80165.1 DUF4369 domain-containing protein [Marixanthomonas sp. SCSIO 43207]
MRNLFILTLIAITVACSSDSKKEMQLSGNVKGLKKGTLLLQKIDDSILVSIDSVVVDGNSNFSFSEEINSPEMYYLYLRLKDGSLRDDRIPFFAEPGEITIETSLKNFGKDFSINGSENEKALNDYKKLMKRFSDRDLDLIKEELTAQKEGGDSLINAIKKKKAAALSSKYLATVNFALNNKDKEVAPYLLLSEIYDANVKYLDTVYTSLTPNVKDSKYGKLLESFISERKTMNDSL